MTAPDPAACQPGEASVVCDRCAGTGWQGHPDDPAGKCTKCDGYGGLRGSAGLEPCPFCGGPASLDVDGARRGTPRQSCIVVCRSCGAQLETGEEGDRCGQSWNHRAPDPTQAARVQALEGEVERLKLELDKAKKKQVPDGEHALMQLLLDWHDWQESCADGCGMPGSANYHRERRHKIRDFFIKELAVKPEDIGVFVSAARAALGEASGG